MKTIHKMEEFVNKCRSPVVTVPFPARQAESVAERFFLCYNEKEF